MVEYLSGKREQLSFGKESIYGTAVTPTDLFGINARWEPTKLEQNFQERQGAASDSVQILAYEKGPLSLGGNIIYTPLNWKLLTFLLGSQVTTGTDPYTHTFSNDPTIPSLTLERAIQHTTPEVHTYAGTKINQWTLAWDAGGGGPGTGAYVGCTADVNAKKFADGSSVTSLSAPTDIGFQFRHVKLTINSVEILGLISGNLITTNNLDAGRFANATQDREIREQQPQTRRFGGRFSIFLEDGSIHDLWEPGNAVGGTNTLELIRGVNDKLTMTFTNLMLRSPQDPTNLEGPNTVDLDWVATDVAFVAVDSIATYP